MINQIKISNVVRLASFVLLIGIFLESCKSTVLNVDTDTEPSSLSSANKYNLIEIDAFGNTYLLTNKNVLQKFDENNNLLFEYSFNRQGQISRVDASNPQKILVYLQEFQNIVFLDNTLSVIKTLNLENLGYWAINNMALSNDNFIWIYDPNVHQLIKINENGQRILQSNELIQDNINDAYVNRIMVDNNKVYLACENQIICFNQFGQFDKVLPLEYEKVQLFNKQFVFLKDKTIHRQSLKIEYLFEENDVVHTSDKPLIDFKLSREGKLFLLDANGLTHVQLR
jgi:hypothetical protein